MPKRNPTTLLLERLRKLLAERRALRLLLARYQMFIAMRQFNDARTALEQEVAAIVSAGLPFDEKERLYNIPQARHLAECAYGFKAAPFNQPQLQAQPELVWNFLPVPGILADNWHPLVKQRLLDLCGPLDAPLDRMLSA